MNIVSPLRDPETVRRVKTEAEKMGTQPYMLMLLGLNTGLRISDLLEVKVKDLRERGFIVRREKKTGKQTEIRFNEGVVNELLRLTSKWDGERYLFESRHAGHRHIVSQTAYNWIVTACRRAGVKEPVGCHTMRKTYGYHFYQKYHDVATLMRHFNHSSEDVTMRYIGITQEMVNEKTTRFRL